MEQSKVLMHMKKLKLSVMLCTVLLGLWFMSGEVFAATIRQTKTSTKENPVSYIDYSSRADGKYDMTVGVYLDDPDFKRSVLQKVEKYKVTIYTDTECTEVVSGYSFIKEEFTAPAAGISTDKKAPVSISLGTSQQEIKGPAGVQGNVYYTFTLKDAATVTGSISGIGTYFLYNENDTQKYTDRCSSETKIQWELPAYTMTSYKLTVTLKKNPPKGASTYVVINDQYLRAKGKTYTVTGKFKGKPGQKEKVTVRFGRNKGYGGLGKYVSKQVTIR